MNEPFTLPSGVPPAELGLAVGRREARVPLGLLAPEGEAVERILALAPGRERPPAWWSGSIELRRPGLVVSFGALSLNNQVLRLLEAGANAGVRSLVVAAPAITDEALVTLLVNDLAGAFPDGLAPVQTFVPEYHVVEVIAAIAAFAGVVPWDGRAPVQVARLGRFRGDTGAATLERAAAPFAGARGLLRRLRG